MTQKALYIDYEFCSGCHSCEVACRNEICLLYTSDAADD